MRRLERQHDVALCRDFLEEEADARIRTADPFITSDDVYAGTSLQIGVSFRSSAGLNPP
jgi:hypothetical protein